MSWRRASSGGDGAVVTAVIGRIIAAGSGRVARAGEPAQVLTADLLRDIFGVVAHVTTDPDGRPICVPLRSTGGSNP